MGIADGERLDHLAGCAELCLGFPGKPGDEIGAQAQVRDGRVQRGDQLPKIGSPVGPVHEGQNGVVAALQGKVQMGAYGAGVGEAGDEIRTHIHRLKGTEANARDGRVSVNALQQCKKAVAGGEVNAIRAEMDAA